jgi:hypothetical protein
MPGSTTNQNIPYPLANDPVNVHEDIQNIAESVDLLLTELQVPNLPLNVKNNNAFTLTKGTPVYINGYDVFPTVAKSMSNNIDTFPVIGLVKNNITSGSSGEVVVVGLLENVDTSLFSSGDYLYVGESGGLVNVRPSSGSGIVAVVGRSNAIEGTIIVGPIKGGNATWGAIKNGI